MPDKLIEQKGRLLIEKLFEAAESTGEVNIDEKTIIHATKVNINQLVEYVKKAYENKEFSKDELKKIRFFVKKIEDDAVTLATYDEFVTDEEDSLLRIIKELVKEFIIENY